MDHKHKIMDRPLKPKYVRYSVSSTLVVLIGCLVVVYNQTEKTRKQVTSTKSPGKRKAVNVVNHFSRATLRQVAEDNFP